MTSLQTVSSEAVNFMAMQAASGGELDSLLRQGILATGNESFELLSSVVPAMLMSSLDRTKPQSAGSQYNPESFQKLQKKVAQIEETLEEKDKILLDQEEQLLKLED